MKEFVIEGQKSYWGDKCSDKFRKPSTTGRKPVIDDLFAFREKLLDALPSASDGQARVGLPRAMSMLERLPVLETLLRRTRGSDGALAGDRSANFRGAASKWRSPQPCYPVQVAHGHVQALLEAGRGLRAGAQHGRCRIGRGCVRGALLPVEPDAAVGAAVRAGARAARSTRFLIPTLHFQLGPAQVKRALAETMRRHRASPAARAIARWMRRMRSSATSRNSLLDAGTPRAGDAGADRRAGPRAGGPRVQHLRPQRELRHPAQAAPSLRRQRHPARFPGDRPRAAGRPRNMFWISGRKILEAARIAAERPNLHMIYITNFKCGPDSYIKHFAREAAGAPLLVLQFDGHGNDAGYMTRCEAYLDSKGILRCYQSRRSARQASRAGDHPLKGKRIYIPPMAYGSARAFAAAFRAIGLDAEPTPPSDHRTRELGARYTSGDECYPAKVTVGDFMKVLEQPGDRSTRGSRSSCRRRRDPAASANTRPTCARSWTRNGYARSRDAVAYQPERLRRAGRAGEAVRAHRLARAALRRSPAEAAADRAGRTRSGAAMPKRLYEESLADLCRTLEGIARRARRAARSAARLHDPLPRPLPPARRAPRPVAAADRHRGRDLLPPEYFLERKSGAVPGRVRRRGLALATSSSGSGTPTRSTSGS